MKFIVTIVATVHADSYKDAVDFAAHRCEVACRRGNDYPLNESHRIPYLKPTRIDVKLEGESE